MSRQEQQSVAVRALRTENTVLQQDNEVLRRENQVLHRRIGSFKNQTREMSGQTLLQQIQNQKKENRQDREAMTRQMEALKDQIQELNTKLQDGNALNDKFKEEGEAMRQEISSRQQQNHDLNETVEALKVFEQKYNDIKEENEAVRQQTEALKQNIQVLNTKLQDGNALNDKFKEEEEAMRREISSHQQQNHELKETVEALKVFEQNYNEMKEEDEAVRQQTEALKQIIQELNTKLHSEQNLCVQEQVWAAEMEATLGQQEELKRKDEQLRALAEEYNTEKEAMSQKIDALQLEIQELRENHLKKLKEEEALRVQEQEKTSETGGEVHLQKELARNVGEECGKLVHPKQQRHESEAEILKRKAQHLDKMCSREKKQKDAFKLENAALRQKMEEQEELTLKVMDGYEETIGLKKRLHEIAVQEFAIERKTLTENYTAVKVEMEALRQSYDALQRENQKLRDDAREEKSLQVQEQVKTSETEGEVHLQKEPMHNVGEECSKLVHPKQQQHESEAEILKRKVHYLDKMCLRERKQKDAFKLENAALRQKIKKQEELTLKVMDGYEETNELKKRLHEDEVQELATELKTVTGNYNAVKVEMEALRQSYDALQQENQKLREEGKSLREQEQLKTSEMEQQRLLHKELVQKLREELDKMIHLKQKLHDGETESLNCQLNAVEEKCETVKVQKEVLSQENAALLRQVLELSRKLQAEKSSSIQQQQLAAQSEEELCDKVEALQVQLQLKTRENEALQSEIQSLKLKMNPPDKVNVEKLDSSSPPQGGWTLPNVSGWLSQLVKQEKQRDAHKTPPIFYLKNNHYTKIDSM